MKYRIKIVDGVGFYPQIETGWFIFKNWYSLHKWQGRIQLYAENNRDYPYPTLEEAKKICDEYDNMMKPKLFGITYESYSPDVEKETPS